MALVGVCEEMPPLSTRVRVAELVVLERSTDARSNVEV